jgi:hypothetical protein
MHRGDWMKSWYAFMHEAQAMPDWSKAIFSDLDLSAFEINIFKTFAPIILLRTYATWRRIVCSKIYAEFLERTVQILLQTYLKTARSSQIL